MKKLKTPRSLRLSDKYKCYAGVETSGDTPMLYIGGPYYWDAAQIHVPLDLKEIKRLRKYIVRVENYVRSRL